MLLRCRPLLSPRPPADGKDGPRQHCHEGSAIHVLDSFPAYFSGIPSNVFLHMVEQK